MSLRVALAASLATGALVAAAPAGAAVPVYDTAKDCINRNAGTLSTHLAGDPFDVRARSGQLADAKAYRAAIHAKDIWDQLADHMGKTRPNVQPGGKVKPFAIYVAPTGGPFGALRPYCTAPDADAIVVRPGLSTAMAQAVLAHEAYHAFSAGVAGKGFTDGSNWLEEAAATWAETELVGFAGTGPYDDAFLGHPELPLDLFDGATTLAEKRHAYGAFRYLRWVDSKLGSTWDMLKATVKPIAKGTDPTAALRSALHARGVDLEDELGPFWADHIRVNPVNGPPTEGRHVTATASKTFAMAAKSLAGDVMRIHVGGQVKRVTVSAPAQDDGGHLWTVFGDQPVNWTHGGSFTFCVGQAGKQGPPWPGQLPLAFANGSIGAMSTTIEVATSEKPCDDPPEDSSLPKSLPTSCPGPPAPRPQGDHTKRWVFNQRVMRINLDFAGWILLEHRNGIQRHEMARRARWIRCTAQRLRATPAPDAEVRSWRNGAAAQFEVGAARLVAGNVPGYQGAMAKARQLLMRIGVAGVR